MELIGAVGGPGHLVRRPRGHRRQPHPRRVLLLPDGPGHALRPFKSISQANNTIQQAMAGRSGSLRFWIPRNCRKKQAAQKSTPRPFPLCHSGTCPSILPGTQEPALKDINLEIRAGERVAFVGQSGAGKTSLVQLIPRFHDCQKGEILLNGLPLHDYTLPSLRTNIGIVSQDPFLFNLTPCGKYRLRTTRRTGRPWSRPPRLPMPMTSSWSCRKATTLWWGKKG
jgi:hypothetical protein